MEHERCYIYAPTEPDRRPSKRRKTSELDPQANLPTRLEIYRTVWTAQNENIQTTLEEADSATQEKIVEFVAASAPSQHDARASIPAGLIIAGPSIASHGPYFERLGKRIRDETNSSYVVLTSGQCPNLKTFLKSLVRKITSCTEEDDDEDDHAQLTNSSRRGPKLLNFDLGHVQEWLRKSRVQSIVVAIQDSEAFDTTLLVEMADLFYSWLDRLPFVLLYGIATSAESLEERLSGKSLRYLDGQRFDVTQSDEIVERLFRATVAHPDTKPRIGATLCRRMLDRQKDHVQSVQDFIDGLNYAYMSHFYANAATVFLKSDPDFSDFSSEDFETVRNLPSFRRYVEKRVEDGETQDALKLLESDEYLFEVVQERMGTVQKSLCSLSIAARVFTRVRDSLLMTPNVRLSAIWSRAASGELLDSPLHRETMLAIKKASSDKLIKMLNSLVELKNEDLGRSSGDSDIPIELEDLASRLQVLVETNADSGPLKSQDDVRNESVRTTVVAQKVLLSKHRAALSEQDKAYSEILTSFYEALDDYFRSSFIDPQKIFLYEILIYDLKSPHTEVFQPRPRFAVERALAAPHDYLGCNCCGVVNGSDNSLGSTQPATAIVYQLYLESGTLINVSDLWLAFHAMVGKEGDDDESHTMALFQRALAELKYLGLVRPSRKKTDHIAKMMWKGL